MSATASRRRLPHLDARLVIGILLVVASVVGVIAVVAGANRTVAIYAASGPIAAGEPLTTERLSLVQVHEQDSVALYLSPEALPDGEVIATRPIGAGELIPVSALGAADASMSTVVVPISGTLPVEVTTGATVALWSSVPGEQPGSYTEPRVLVAEAQVIRVVEQDRMIATGEVELELRLPAHLVATVLGDVTNGARLHVIPVHSAPAAPVAGP